MPAAAKIRIDWSSLGEAGGPPGRIAAELRAATEGWSQ